MVNRKLYYSWNNMMRRCYSENNANYSHYGGRGIEVCAEWHSFVNFRNDMEKDYLEGLTLDRIDVDGNYEPHNCRWATQLVQQNNRSNNRKHTFNGLTMTLYEWAREIGVNRSTLSARYYKHGWDIERCLTTPVRKWN